MVSKMKATTKKGFTLIELMAASAIAIIMLSLFVGAYQTVVQHYAMSELPQRGDQIATSLYYYYLDTGVYPPGDDSAGLSNLYTNTAGVAGWKGPYLRLQMGDGIVDPWGRPFLYRRGNTPTGQPVFLILSLGRNGVLDSDLSAWTSPDWDTSGDDWARVFSQRAPISYFEDKTYNTLRFVAGMVYNASPGTAPATFNAGAYRDAWGRPLVYHRCNDYSAVVYSLGANGQDNSNLGATVCTTARKQRDDLTVSLIWNGGRPRIASLPGGGNEGCRNRGDGNDDDHSRIRDDDEDDDDDHSRIGDDEDDDDDHSRIRDDDEDDDDDHSRIGDDDDSGHDNETECGASNNSDDDDDDSGGDHEDDHDDHDDDDDCLRWLPPPWQPNPPGGNGNQPPWQQNPPNGTGGAPPWNDRPPGRPWRDPNMPCRGVDRNFCRPGDPRWGEGSCSEIR